MRPTTNEWYSVESRRREEVAMRRSAIVVVERRLEVGANARTPAMPSPGSSPAIAHEPSSTPAQNGPGFCQAPFATRLCCVRGSKRGTVVRRQLQAAPV